MFKYKKQKSFLIISFIIVTTILFFIIHSYAQTNTIANEETMLRMVESLSRANDSNNAINTSIFESELNRYVGSGSATITNSTNVITVKFTKTGNLYEIYKNPSYTITYNLNGGTGNIENQTKKQGHRIRLSSIEPVRSGYSFVGWSTDNTQENVKYQANDLYMDNENLTLYAMWKKTYAIYSADDNSLRFYKTTEDIQVGDIYNGLTATTVYPDIEHTAYTIDLSVPSITSPWFLDGNFMNITSVVVEDEIRPTNTVAWFGLLGNCMSFDLAKLDTSRVTDMTGMFGAVGGVENETLTLNLAGWDTSNVQNMSFMFLMVGRNYLQDTYSEKVEIIGLDR